MGYLYKYINMDGSIEYIGKTTRPIKYRIIEHQSTDLSYFNGQIYYAEIENNYDLDIAEMALIRKYNPIKNKKKYDVTNLMFTIDETKIQWQLFTTESNEGLIQNTATAYCDLKRLLFMKGMSQNKLSDITGIRSATINDMCNGKTKNLPLKNISKICTALNCGVEDLIKIT